MVNKKIRMKQRSGASYDVLWPETTADQVLTGEEAITVKQHIGLLSELTTTSNTDLVGAINENKGRIDENDVSIDTISFNVKNHGAIGDNITDDSIAINKIINDVYTSGGGTVLIPSGYTFRLYSQINMKSNIRLVIDGILKLKDNGSSHIIMIDGCSNVIIEGKGVVDGSRASITTVEHLAGIYSVNSANHITIKDITVKSCKNWTVNIVNSHDVLLDNLKLSDSSNSAEFANGCYNCIARNIEVFNVDDYGFAFYGGVYNSSITNSFVHNNGIDGIVVLTDAGQTQICNHINIIGNTVYSNNYSGISLRNDLVNAIPHNNININSNQIHHNNKSNISGLGGIWVQIGHNINISNNIIHDDGNGNNSSVGINLSPQDKPVNRITLIGNIITNEGIGGGLGVGIQFGGALLNVNVSSNMIDDTQTPKTMAYCINYMGGDVIMINNNRLGASIGQPINYYASIDNKAVQVYNNIGYNPIGKISVPVGASNATVKNTLGYPVRVFVHGGVVSNIAINNEYISLTNGCFLLAPSETIAIVYSDIPYWEWYGM